MAAPDYSVQGEIAKLAQIGTNNGSVFIVDQAPVKNRLQGIQNGVKLTNEGSTISLFVVSKRFGRRVEVSVPPGIRAAALAEVLVDILQLPRNYRVEELLLELVFSYTVRFQGDRIGPFTALNDAGVTERCEIELEIDFGWKDPISPTPQETHRGGGNIMFNVLNTQFPQ